MQGNVLIHRATKKMKWLEDSSVMIIDWRSYPIDGQTLTFFVTFFIYGGTRLRFKLMLGCSGGLPKKPKSFSRRGARLEKLNLI